MEWVVGIGFVVLFALLLLRVPVGFAMIFVGVAGYAMIVNWEASLLVASEIVARTAQSYEFTVIPLFVLMGNFIARSNLSQELYDVSYAFLGHRKGGLAMATIVASTGFSAVCGSSLATAATMAKVAMPPMKRYGYADSLATGSIAAGGTLGILIPPSAALILYGIITQTDISKLFVAGILPGLLGALCYLGAIVATTLRDPALGPPGERSPWSFKWRALSKVWPVLMLFLIVLGGLYLGIFSATEAAGVGAMGAFLFALLRGTLSWRGLLEVLLESGLTTGMLLVVLIGALIFANLINIAALPNAVADWIAGMQISATAVVITIIVIYLLLGCLLESISMMLLTVPIFFPVVANLGVDPVWFGIVVVVAIEISLITPPIGLNIFVLNAVLPDIPLRAIYRGVLPFVFADVIRIAILVAVPAIALVLPSLMD